MSTINIPNELPVDLIGPDIAAYAVGNTGIPYVWSFEAGRPGPHVMISAIVHGNEPCGSVALDWLMSQDVRPLKGTLTLAFMNTQAASRFDPADPNASRWVDEDFNRVWSAEALASDRDSVELRRARQVQPLVASADYLLDLHSMQQPAPGLALAGWQERGVRLAQLVGVPDRIVIDRGHAAGMRMRDHGAFSADDGQAAALLLECGQHWETGAADLAKEASARFLTGLSVIGPELLDGLGALDPAPQTVWEVAEAVTITSERYTHTQPFTGGEIIAEKGTLLGHDGERPVVSPHDDCMLVMPSKRLWRGQTAVRLARRRD
ncbi:MAG: succinylglutamate desuccinylase/aspartoacylase family protein [Paracoccaceae bacterium]|nr:succinylglutamate desuccinylase/aspartoacylase family protein [Paracoccaceae bacterium]